MPPLEAFAADLLALLEAPAPCAARDREHGTAGPRAVPAAVPTGPAISSKENNILQKPGPLGPPGPRKTDVSGLAPIAERATPPATPAPEPVTVAGLLELHGEIVAGCRTLDVLAEADDSDLPDFLDCAVIEGFALALVADRRVRPLPDAALLPLARLALELGDDPAELRHWLDGSTVGRRIRQRIEREPLAIDRCLLALRSDPDAPLLLLLARALDGADHAEPVPARADDGREQGPGGDWRTQAGHDAIRAFDRHHWRCTICQRAGQGYGDRCPTGAALHAATRAHA